MEMTLEEAKKILDDADNYTASAVEEAKRIVNQAANSETTNVVEPATPNTTDRPVLSGKLNPDATDEELEQRAIDNNLVAAGVTSGELEEPLITDETDDDEKETRAIEENKKAEEELKKKEAEQAALAKNAKEKAAKEKDVGNSGDPEKDTKKIIPKGDKNNRHYKAVKSIWSAYYDGDFGEPGSKEAKEVAWYYTIDSLAKLGNKIGKSLRNVGAAYTGGAIDNSEDEKSEWAKNRETLRNEAVSMTQEEMGGKASRQATAENLANDLQKQAKARGVPLNNLINYLNEAAENAPNDQMKLAYLGFAAAAGNGEVSDAQMIAMQATGLIEKFQENPEKFMEEMSNMIATSLQAAGRGARKGLIGF